MSQYALYKYNYKYLDSYESPEYERSYNRLLINIFDDKDSAIKAQIIAERNSDIPLVSRSEWYNLNQEKVKELKNFFDSNGVDAPFLTDDTGDLIFKVWDFDIQQLDDHQLLAFLSIAGVQYEVEEYIEVYEQNVLYTNALGYVQEDPYGYSDDFVSIHSTSDLQELMLEGWYIETPIINLTIKLTANDLARPEFWTLTEKYADKINVETDDKKQSGTLKYIEDYDIDYQCLQEFSEVLDNPFFIFHSATNLDIKQISENPNHLLEKYKYSGLK